MEVRSNLSERLNIEEADDEDVDSAPLVNSSESGKYFCFYIPTRWIYVPPDGETEKPKTNSIGTIFLSLNTMIGAGILVQPHIFMETGILVATFEFIVVGIMTYIGVYVLMKVAEHHQVFDYTLIMDKVFQKNGGKTADAAIALGQAGATLSYVLIIGLLFSEVLESCSQWYCNRSLLSVFTIACISVPLCLIRRLGHLVIASTISTLIIGATVLLVIIGGPLEDNSGDEEYQLADGLGALKNLGGIVFAMEYIVGIFYVYDGMENQSVSNYSRLLSISTAIGCFLCFIIGLAGYLSFRDDTEVLIVENFDGPTGGIFKMGVAIHLLLFFPGDLNILRASLTKLCEIDVLKQSNNSFIMLTLALITVIVGTGVLLQQVGGNGTLMNVINVSGGSIFTFLSFIIPGACGMYTFTPDTSYYLYLQSWLLVLFGVFIVLVVIISSFL